MYNIPADREILRDKVMRSVSSFGDKLPNKSDAKYIFVAEDVKNKKVIGTSQIAAQHGTTEAPHFYFEVGSEEKFSETIGTGFIHGTLKLKYDTNGPSEIGGLVLDPDFRNSEARVGRQISFVRFLFLGMNKTRFKRKVIAELLPPLNKKGQSPLWEAIGRRFTNMDYWEADELCQRNKEFIFSLFPSGKIYTTFLPAEAKNSIGKVGKETEPVLHMLTKIGFSYKSQVDPFDGGPHLWANVDDILPVKKLGNYTYDPSLEVGGAAGSDIGLLTRAGVRPGSFRAVSVRVGCKEGKLNVVEQDRETAVKLLGIEPGEPLVFMPYY
jgi:arginine N-succinyltransferase